MLKINVFRTTHYSNVNVLPYLIKSYKNTRFYSNKPQHQSQLEEEQITSEESEDDLITRIKIKPVERVNESIAKKRARLIYQSRKRGILETDLLLSGFAAKYLKTMNEKELEEYDQFLNELDWDIYYWVTKNYKITPLPKKWENSSILAKLQDFAENKEKKMLRMPELSKYK
ncbi:related to Succinate dehydrogenase assembly factor 2, mitochondrial [Saccharomycodes ludwigii]|uniref:Succinate dehydrogenase assembly factor 2, mitochondrial n=1 Tax=Saccharomycodes ludwigii TaxID=36035 RepID=A0A376B7D0_9ASCO|nr:hypothetical protein SCDLUD_005054 [Saccharomycodes ludwigii]KAH3898727.1 hypothetical protein SCDLUD_005054 [Saccharomycodes ludwigii]SSD60552.1 related to Succinate dehydrogenase assembly factor 2, mitochondrial [Saccharomycodes ludwigii]